MKFIVIRLDEGTAHQLDIALDKIQRDTANTLTDQDADAIESLRYQLTTQRIEHYTERHYATNSNNRWATDEGEGPPPGSPYWEA